MSSAVVGIGLPLVITVLLNTNQSTHAQRPNLVVVGSQDKFLAHIAYRSRLGAPRVAGLRCSSLWSRASAGDGARKEARINVLRLRHCLWLILITNPSFYKIYFLDLLPSVFFQDVVRVFPDNHYFYLCSRSTSDLLLSQWHPDHVRLFALQPRCLESNVHSVLRFMGYLLTERVVSIARQEHLARVVY